MYDNDEDFGPVEHVETDSIYSHLNGQILPSERNDAAKLAHLTEQ